MVPLSGASLFSSHGPHHSLWTPRHQDCLNIPMYLSGACRHLSSGLLKQLVLGLQVLLGVPLSDS